MANPKQQIRFTKVSSVDDSRPELTIRERHQIFFN